MKKENETGAKVITFLASCGSDEVDTSELLSAVVEGFKKGDDPEQAYCMVRGTLRELAAEGLVSLRFKHPSARSGVPGSIRIRPRMKNAAARLMERKEAGKAGAGNRGVPRNEVEARYYTFLDLMDKKGKRVKVEREWGRLIATIIYQDIEEDTGFQACVESFINGLIWQSLRRDQGGDGTQAGEDKPELSLQPGLLGQIDAILEADEERNGRWKGGRSRRRQVEEDAPLTELDRDEIQYFIAGLNRLREEGSIQPGRLWQQALGKYFNNLLNTLPVYRACRESFRAGIVFQMHRRKLEA